MSREQGLTSGLIVLLAIGAILAPGPAYAQETDTFEIMAWTGYFDVNGMFHIVGEVQNNSDRTIHFPEAAAVMYDRDGGSVVAIDRAFLSVEYLRPGEKAPFHIVSLNGDAIINDEANHIEIRVSGSDATTEGKPGQLEIKLGSDNVDAAGFYHIYGEVTNNGDVTANFVQVTAALYSEESADEIVDVVTGFTEPENIAPGETAPFELIMARPDAGTISDVSVTVDSDEFANVVVPELPIPLLALAGGIGAAMVALRRRSLWRQW